jgi:hypothetical protein
VWQIDHGFSIDDKFSVHKTGAVHFARKGPQRGHRSTNIFDLWPRCGHRA